jgi:hypothetical protein
MDKQSKCAHQSCVCLVSENGEFGGYCSAHCRDAKNLSELRCECGHTGCAATSTRGAGGPK